jgi:hypothetical protein
MKKGNDTARNDNPPAGAPSSISQRANVLLTFLHPLLYILLVLPLIPGYPITQDAFYDVLLKYYYCYPAFIFGAVGLLSIRYHLSRGEDILTQGFWMKIAIIAGIITCILIPLTFNLSEDVMKVFIVLNMPIFGLVFIIGYGLISEHRSLERKLRSENSSILTFEGILVSLYYFYPPLFLLINFLMIIRAIGN